MTKKPEKEAPVPKTANKAQRGRSLAIAWVLAALVVMFYLITIIKMGPTILDRPL